MFHETAATNSERYEEQKSSPTPSTPLVKEILIQSWFDLTAIPSQEVQSPRFNTEVLKKEREELFVSDSS